MRRLSESERDPIRATTFGVGEMLLDATKRGANEIIIGLGGSATNDGGFGMARALGFQFFGEGENEIQSVAELPLLKRMSDRRTETTAHRGGGRCEESVAWRKWRDTSVWSTKRGEQKRPRQLERALTRLADVVATEFGFDYRNEAGAGAAGASALVC